ncbi:hypothetical protein T492DRAFT_451300 [Pavlovales sp. CCMP2436]|nr:hypothetical protein T492DRAFT_451300 [Pavlovales sp. CCMP2436]
MRTFQGNKVDQVLPALSLCLLTAPAFWWRRLFRCRIALLGSVKTHVYKRWNRCCSFIITFLCPPSLPDTPPLPLTFLSRCVLPALLVFFFFFEWTHLPFL